MEFKKDDFCSIQKSSSIIQCLFCLFKLVLDKCYILLVKRSFNFYSILFYNYYVLYYYFVLPSKPNSDLYGLESQGEYTPYKSNFFSSF